MIAILSDPAVGATFLTWSLHYLAGHKKHYNANIKSWEPVIDNPVTATNAHGFTPNMPSTVDHFNSLLDELIATPTDTFHTLYLHNLDYANKQDHASETQNTQTVQCVLNAMKATDKRIVLTTNPTHSLYHSNFTTRILSKKLSEHKLTDQNNKEHHIDFINYFFGKSIILWNQQQLTNIWDQREFLALNCRPYNIIRISPNIDLTQNHYTIDTFDLYNTFNKSVKSLFDYLEVSVDQKNLNHWQDIYQSWRQIQFDRLIFVWYFDQIINYIIHGYDMDLLRFNLDIIQEASIQHYLIYKHNLNLKTWQLDKFKNTKQLHNLLEPNIHPLGKY